MYDRSNLFCLTRLALSAPRVEIFIVVESSKVESIERGGTVFASLWFVS